MQKSWAPQQRSCWYYNPFLLIIVGIFSFIFAGILYIFNKLEVSLGVIGCYCFYIYWVWEELKRWDVNGYRVITVDTGNALLVFDNKLKIPFRAVSEMNFSVCSPPERVWWLRSRHEWFNNLNEFCSFLEIKTMFGERISFAIQDRLQAQDIIKYLKFCGFKIYMTSFDENDLRRSWLSYLFIIIPIFFVLVVLLLGLFM